MPKIVLRDGRWLQMRLATVNEQLAIIDLPAATEKGARIDRLRFFRDMLRDATSETSWGGDPGDLSTADMSSVIQPWLRATEDDAVPPDSGSSSDTTRRAPSSQAPTGSRKRSPGRRSSKS